MASEFLNGPDMISDALSHSRRPVPGPGARQSRGTEREPPVEAAEVVYALTKVRGGLVQLRVLREGVDLPRLPGIEVSIGRVVPFDERDIDLLRDARTLEGVLQLFRSAEELSGEDLYHASLAADLVDDRVDHSRRGDKTRLRRSASRGTSRDGHSLAVHLQQYVPVGLIEVGRDQFRRNSIGAGCKVFDRPSNTRHTSLPGDHAHGELRLHVQRYVVPDRTQGAVSGIVRVAPGVFFWGCTKLVR